MIGEELSAEQEHGNPEDAFAVAITKSETTVGYIPKAAGIFIAHGGEICCKISERRQQLILLEGGLEVPCIYTFKGKKKLVDKLTTILQEMKFKLLS